MSILICLSDMSMQGSPYVRAGRKIDAWGLRGSWRPNEDQTQRGRTAYRRLAISVTI
jgi:hypothetical protein